MLMRKYAIGNNIDFAYIVHSAMQKPVICIYLVNIPNNQETLYDKN